MREWREEYRDLTGVFPQGFEKFSREQLQGIVTRAAAMIRECTFDLWPTAEIGTVIDLYQMITKSLPEDLRKPLADAISIMEQAKRMKPDTAIVPGQTVYTVGWDNEGRPLEVGEWPPLDNYHKPDFPLDVLPEYLQDLIMALHRESGAPVDYFAGAALSVASLAVFDRANILLDGGRQQPLCLYSILVGRSGVRKSAAFTAMQAPLIDWTETQNKEIAQANRKVDQRLEILHEELKTATRGKSKTPGTRTPDKIQEEMELEEGKKKRFYPSPLTDATMESIAHEAKEAGGAVGILSDEGQIINAIAGKSYTAQNNVPNIDIVLKGYDRAFVNISRSTYKVKGTVCLSLCIGAQPAILETLISHGDQAERGFPQRCLFYYPNPVYDNALERVPCPLDLLAKWRDIIQDLLWEGRSSEIEMKATDAAITMCKLYENAMTAKRQADDEDGGEMAGWYGKAHDKMARVAGILALLENPKGRTVTEKHVSAAIRLFDAYAIPMAQECYGVIGADLPKHLSAVMNAIVKEKAAAGAALDGAVYKRLHKNVRYRGNKSGLYERDLADLEERRYIRRIRLNPGRGRPTTFIQVNPRYEQ